MNWLPRARALGLGKRFLFAISLQACALATIGILFFVQADASAALRKKLSALDHRQTAIQSLLSNLQDAETGQRGYLLTQQPSYLGPYESGRASAAREFRWLQNDLSHAGPRQREDSTELASAMDAKLAELAETVKLQRLGRRSEALQIVQGGAGKIYMDRLRSLLGDLQTSQSQEAAKASAAADDANRWRSRLGVAFIVLALAGIGLAMWQAITALLSAERLARQLAAQREAALRATEAKSRFIAVVSHELRTPMTAILGLSNLLSASGLKPTQAQYVELIRSSGDDMMVVLNDVLDASKLEAGHFQVEKLAVNLPELLGSTIAAWTAVAQAKGLQVRGAMAADVPTSIVGDPTRIRQVLFNLLSNAIKFTETGVIDVRVDVSWRDGSASIRFGVTDSGKGMSSSTVSGLFSDYHQADASVGRVHGGTGLGLSIVRDLARAMGGEVQVSSALGEGSTFTLLLPLVETNPVESPPETRPTPIEPAPDESRKLRVLVADDHPANRLIISELLVSFGADVVTVANGREAVEAFTSDVFDLVLMDVQMPEMDGVEAMRRIRYLQPSTPVPVVALTADALGGDRERYLAHGFNGYLSKPVSPADLLAQIQSAVARQDTTTRVA